MPSLDVEPVCECGHLADMHPERGECTGTVGNMADGDAVLIATTSWGWAASEPCVCIRFVPMDSSDA